MLRHAVVAAVAVATATARLADQRGFFELHMDLAVPGAASSVLFVTRDYRVDDDAAALCAAVAPGFDPAACASGVAAAARDVLDRCLYLIHLGARDERASCKWVVTSDAAAAPPRATNASSLVEIADAYASGPGVEKYRHYFEIYERFLEKFRGRRARALEIGIADGGSSVLWRRWLGASLELHCLDVNPRCVAGDAAATTHHGDQGDAAVLAAVAAAASGPFDVVIDDGGHAMHQQIASFQFLYPRLAPGGVYVVEDVHTSYWPSFGGDSGSSFVDFARDRVDALHYFRAPPAARAKMGPGAREFAAWTKAVSVFESVVVFEKRATPADARSFAPAIRGSDFTPGVGQRSDSTSGIGYPLYDVDLGL